MEYVKAKCKKCGFELELPEKSGSVICGSCGKVNTFTRFTSVIKVNSSGKKTPEQDNQKSSIKSEIQTIPGKQPSDIQKPAYKAIPENIKDPDTNETPAEEEYEFPEQKTASKIITLIFIMAPFIAMAVEFFKLPSYVAIAIILLVVIIALTFKKRS